MLLIRYCKTKKYATALEASFPWTRIKSDLRGYDTKLQKQNLFIHRDMQDVQDKFLKLKPESLRSCGLPILPILSIPVKQSL
jgi:hypothetical protein